MEAMLNRGELAVRNPSDRTVEGRSGGPLPRFYRSTSGGSLDATEARCNPSRGQPCAA